MRSDRIADIRTVVLGHWAFVEVFTENGFQGLGEATYFPHASAVPPIVDDLRRAYLGHSPFAPDFLYQRVLKKHCMRDAASSAAASAIDQALWDIKGKALDVPVWELLGGRVRDRVRAILLIDEPDSDLVLTSAVQAVGEGFTALKIKPFLPGWSRKAGARLLRDVVDLVRAVREAIGWDVDLGVELHRNLTPDQAIQFGDAVRELNLYFVEDAIQTFSTASNIHVADSMRTPTAAGERCTNLWEFRDLSDSHGLAILRPDVGLAGGFTQLRKIAAVAESRHQRIVPHNCMSPVSTACHVHLAAATPNWDVQGYVREDRAPWCDVVERLNELRDGFLVIPEEPGHGMKLKAEAVKNAAYAVFGGEAGQVAAMAMDGGVRQW